MQNRPRWKRTVSKIRSSFKSPDSMQVQKESEAEIGACGFSNKVDSVRVATPIARVFGGPLVGLKEVDQALRKSTPGG